MILVSLLQAAWASKTLRRSFATLIIVGIAGDQIIKYVDKKNDAAVIEFRRGQDAIVRQISNSGRQEAEWHESMMESMNSLQNTVRTMDERVFKLYQDRKTAEARPVGGGRQSARLETFPQE